VRRSIRLAAAAAGLTGFLLYANTAFNGFVFDDLNVVVRNPIAHDPLAVRGIFTSHYWANVETSGDLYRPLTIWSFALNRAATGEGAAGYHLTNAALHGVVSALVALLASALALSAGGAMAAGLLFAVHPIHVEAVAPIVGRSELLAALFALAAWTAYLRGTGGAADLPVKRGPRPWLLVASVISFALAILSKESAVVLPALMLAGDRVSGRSGARSPGLATLGAMGMVIAVWAAVRAAVVPGAPPDDPLVSVFGGVDAITRILTATGVLGRYLFLMGFPATLSADYSYHQIPLIPSILDPIFLASAAACVLLLAVGIRLAARGRISGLGILIYLLAVFPVSNIAFSIGTVMAERLLYFPSIGLCLLAPALYTESGKRHRLAVPALAAILLLLAGRTLARVPDWRDQHTLFAATVKTSPRSAKAHYNLAVAEEDRGDLRAAEEEYRRAIEIKPEMGQARRNYGLLLLKDGRASESAVELREAARLGPGSPDVFSDLGIAYHLMGMAREAEHAFREEIRLRPGSSRANYNLGSLLVEQGRQAEAIEALARAAELDPADADARAQLGSALAAVGRQTEAAAAFEEAIRLNPSLVDLLVPLARSAVAAGRRESAIAALSRARAEGLAIPEDLRSLFP
jgi:tetratricopeptide (TPR) repeat protein